MVDLSPRAGSIAPARNGRVALESAGQADGRSVLIRWTVRGWNVNRIARQVVEEIQQEWAQSLCEEELAHLRRQLHFPSEST